MISWFRAGIACSTEAVPIRVNLIAPPLYVVTTSTPEKQDGLQAMLDACKAIEDKIRASGGSFKTQMAPKVVTATDEADLAKQMEKAEQENAEVIVITLFNIRMNNKLHVSPLKRSLVMTTMRRKKLVWEGKFQMKTMMLIRRRTTVIEVNHLPNDFARHQIPLHCAANKLFVFRTFVSYRRDRQNPTRHDHSKVILLLKCNFCRK